ncbi:MAG TPA: hypothetical protein VIH92_14945 [Solirubrobacteraceae bacterium]|jgi:hypothetical protein
MSADSQFEQEEIDAAATEAAGVGGVAGDEDLDPSERAVLEAGGGEDGGFEQTEQELIEHSSHGDQQSAHVILHHQGSPEESGTSVEDGEPDHEHSSELTADAEGDT